MFAGGDPEVGTDDEPSEGAGDKVVEDRGALLAAVGGEARHEDADNPADMSGEGALATCGAAYTAGDKRVFASVD